MMKYRLLLCAILCAALGQIVPAQAVFTEVLGAVEVRLANAESWTPAIQGANIDPGTTISAGLKSSAIITIGASRILVRPLTRLTLEEIVQRAGSEDVAVFVQTGRVRATVNPPSGGKTNFTVSSPSATASVRGTSFEFDTVNLRVDSGLVHYTNVNGQTVYAAQGETAYIDERDGRVVPPQEIAAAGQLPRIPQNTGADSGSVSLPVQPAVELRIDPKWQ
jgi:hypothetical protein